MPISNQTLITLHRQLYSHLCSFMFGLQQWSNCVIECLFTFVTVEAETCCTVILDKFSMNKFSNSQYRSENNYQKSKSDSAFLNICIMFDMLVNRTICMVKNCFEYRKMRMNIKVKLEIIMSNQVSL